MDAPQKLTDAWADWVVNQLSSNGETALTDDDIAAIIARPDSQTRFQLNRLIAEADDAVIVALHDYVQNAVDANSANVSNAISRGDISSVNTAKQYADTADRDVLAAAKKYTDDNASPGSVTKSYVDTADANVARGAVEAVTASEARSTQYADKKYADAVESAGEYTDTKLSGYVSRGTLDSELQAESTELRQYTDTVASSTLDAAKDYADSIGGGGGDDHAYTDEKISQATNDLQAYATNADNALHDTITGELDTAIEAAADGISALIDGKLADNVSYTDQGDADTLNASKAYTDNAIASGGGSGGGGVTVGYVDAGDSRTLSDAKTYSDSGDSTVYTNAKAYADGKYAKPSTGIPRADLESPVRASLNLADSAMQKSDTSISLAGYAANGYTNTITARNLNGVVKWTGAITPATAGTALTGVPTAWLPKADEVFSCPGDGASVTKVAVQAAGNVVISTPTATTTKVSIFPVVYMP